MWYSPKPITVELLANTFKNMRNLKFLLVENVQISEELEYLPNELRLLQWPKYDFPLPPKFYPQNLVVLNMLNSGIRLEQLLMQVWLLVYMNFDFIFYFFEMMNFDFFNFFFLLCSTARLEIWKIWISIGVNSLQNYLPYYAPQT